MQAAASPSIFAKLTKVDEEKRLVFGRAAEEAVDKSDEIMDYMSSKPHFQKWSADIAADTGGKNLGNVRAMHGKVAAGALTAINFNDAAKAVDVCAHIVDDAEWKKVLAGVYTGFSIGGSYIGEKKVEKADGRDVVRYTARPSEVSLVDRPCMTGAKFFDVQKADGSTVHVDFVEVTADELEVNGTPEEVAALASLMKTEGMNVGDLVKGLPAWLAAKKKGKDGKDATDPKADPEDAADGGDDEAAEKLAKAETDRLAKVETDAVDAMAKLGDDLFDALKKIGARNSKADAEKLAAIHDATLALGHACPSAADDDAEKLAKAETDRLAKVKADADAPLLKLVSDAVAPLQKLLDAQAAEIALLKSQPAAPTVRLRAVAKGEDVVVETTLAKVEPIITADGQKHEAGGLIKALHAQGGIALHLPHQLRG